MLSSISGLIAAIAGLVTAATGLIGMVLVARRTSPRERTEAAEHATRTALDPPGRPDVAAEALIHIHQARKGRRRGR